MLKWKDVKECVQVRFIDKERNTKVMKNLSYKDILDLTVVFYIEIVGNNRTTNCIMINGSIQKGLRQDVFGTDSHL